MSILDERMHAPWGLSAFYFGVAALLAAALVMSGFLVPETDKSIGTTLGEIARDMRDAALGASTEGAQSQAPSTFDVQWLLTIATPILAATATGLGGMSLYRHEPATLSKLAIAFGVSAFLMQFVFWLAVMVCGTVLLISIISNMDGIFGD